MPSLGRSVAFGSFGVLLAAVAVAAAPTEPPPVNGPAPAASTAPAKTESKPAAPVPVAPAKAESKPAAPVPATPPPAATPKAEPTRPAPPAAPAKAEPRLEVQQQYAGVSPDSRNHNPLDAPKGPPAMLVWTGFEKTATGSRVFLQTSAEVQYGSKESTKRIVVTLENCRIHTKNNQRILDTRFFSGTPVRRVTVAKRGKGVEIVIEVRSSATPTTTREGGPDGTHFLMLNFPPVADAGADETGQSRAGGAAARGDDLKRTKKK